MKKYIILFSTVFAVLFGTNVFSNFLKNNTVEVNVMKLELTSAQNIVTCCGKLEYSKCNYVYPKTLSIAKDICVNVGDKVSKNDVLVHATGAVIKNLSLPKENIPDITEIQDFSNIADLQSVYNSFANGKLATDTFIDNYKSTGVAFDILSPVSGIITNINTKNEGIMNKDTPVITISDTSKLQVRVPISEAQISEISVGQTVYITGAGFKNDEYKGRVESISNEAKQVINTTGKETTVDVIVSVDSTEKNIKPGLTAKCKIITSEEKDKLILPYNTVRADNDGKEYVYLYNNGIAQKAFIKSGKEYPNGYEIISGVSNENFIILDPEKVRENSRVHVSKEAMVINNA